MPTVAFSVASVQVAQARKVAIAGRSILTAIHKTAVMGPVEVKPLGLLGDEQADLSVHGGLEKAVYAYPAEHYAFWMEARRNAGVADIDTALPYGSIGENLTLYGQIGATSMSLDLPDVDGTGWRRTVDWMKPIRVPSFARTSVFAPCSIGFRPTSSGPEEAMPTT